MPICPLTGLSFEHHELERRHYERFGLPVPDIHPLARRIQKLAFANAWDLYWTTDARTGKRILSCYDPAEHSVVYDRTYWTSTDFDARAYGRAFDFSRGFFEQYFEMVAEIPKPNLVSVASENVDYCNNTFNSKNCYLSFNILEAENIIYGTRVFQSRDCINVTNCRKCELCYGCDNCYECYDLFWSDFCERCTDSRFLSNCTDCTNCYQCANMKHKQYCIQNVQYSPDEYERRMAALHFSSYDFVEEEKKRWNAFLETQPLQGQRNINCEDSSGVLLKNCKSCISCFTLTNAEQCFQNWGNRQIENSDSSGEDAQYHTNTLGIVSSQKSAHSLWIEHSYDIYYSQYIMQSTSCFGCYGVKKTSNCLFNKNYSVQEYGQLKERIIEHMRETGEWGQYFPVSYAPFPYEKTLAQCITATEFDDSPQVIKNFGFRSEGATSGDSAGRGLPSSELPDSSADADESLIGKVFACEETGRPYSFIKQELAFYKKYHLPLPRISWRTAIEKHYPVFYPAPHPTLCSQCGDTLYSYLRPDKTTRRIVCDLCLKKLAQ